MTLIQLELLLLSAVLQQYSVLTISTSSRKQLKDVQLKIPLQIRARRFCTDTNCIKTCPKDYEMDPEQQYCRYQRSTCPPNYVRRQGSCILLEVQCPPGSVRQGNRCVVKSFECPQGYVLEGTNCVNSRYCPDGYRWENGFCYQQHHRSRICPQGYERQSGVCIQICANCEAACSECQEETAPLQCPTGYVFYREKCIKLLQGRADVVVRNVTYKVPKECEHEAFYNDGSCVSWKFEKILCTNGHFYGGSCVSVARCNRGLLQNDCECIEETISTAVCQQGQPSAEGCVIGKAYCTSPAKLVNGMCFEVVDSHKPFCEVGTLSNDFFCDVGSPQCPSGFVVDDHICKSSIAAYPMQCSSSGFFHGWCSTNASCEYGYQLEGNGVCVRNVIREMESCPSSTIEAGKICIFNLPLCDSDHVFDNAYGLCVKCEEKSVICNEESGYHYNNGTCLRYDSVCPLGYSWNKTHCVRISGDCKCQQGFQEEQYCIHSHLTCPENYHFVSGFCLKIDSPTCPERGSFSNGICITSPQCPAGFVVGPEFCEDIVPIRLNTTVPTCLFGFNYENGNCVKIIWKNAVSETRRPDCPFGYELSGALCIKKFYGYLICPPKTILMNEENKCFCKVDLVCPTGYERIGDECVFRSINYFSSSLNFLNPCYGSQCGLQYCLTQCFSPPCPVQPCSYGTYKPQLYPTLFNNHDIYNPCGIGEDCTSYDEHHSVVSLTCPPGFSKENNMCVAYYNRICQTGYKLQNGKCVRTEELKPLCTPGFSLVNETCLRIRCGIGYMRDGIRCKRLEYRPPLSCPKDYIIVHGFCLHKNDCAGGSIEGIYCVRKRYESYVCPRGYLLQNNTCIASALCTNSDSILWTSGCIHKKYMPLICPPGTRRIQNMCVHLDPPFCDVQLIKTNCLGEIRGDECISLETPRCGEGYILKDDKCAKCSTKSPNCPSNMIIIDGKCMLWKHCKNGSFLNRDGKCVSIEIKVATCKKGILYFGKCLEELPECHDGYTLVNGHCVKIDPAVPICRNGFLYKGRCVRLARCKGNGITLKNGWCIRHNYSDLTCDDETIRIRDVCINGVPKCPDNYFFSEGHCCSVHIQSAECNNNGKCIDNFCSLSFPSCSPTFFFDGSVCKKLLTSSAKCPVGTTPDNTDRSYCQYSSEHAESICPAEFYFHNGICQKRLYADKNCPSGFQRKQNICVRKACSNPKLTSLCGAYELTKSPIAVLENNSQTPKTAVNQIEQHSQKPSVKETSKSANAQHNQYCCQIFSPRMCEYNNEAAEWSCYHTQHRRCGKFCSYKNQHIYLSPTQSYQMENGVLIMKPLESEDDDNGDEDHNCDDCTDGSHDCDSYCYTYDCQEKSGGCNYMDQAEFCSTYPGMGCSSADGCYDQKFCVS
ncbi:neurogenic locus Notch protein-like [Sabethes cyaneus]|uniref:neurogenic locus Notch protein-like n=1 Tax=Sabethes cyaneus TaxID=53552 RepID=UPI00237E9A57|nr:neurogenic locus Notch protein-like [Sabethes cyaneus]XP_053695750.1 neurogenic locus Notch protein-like [Sabethes cyaneus]